MEDNLRALEVDSLAAVNLRLMEEGDVTVPLSEQLGVMEELRQEGKIAGIGISNATLATLDEALEQVDIVCVQNAFSIVQRDDEPVLERCAEKGIAFVPFFPLGSAFSGGPAGIAAQPQVAQVAAKHGVGTSQVALAWLLALDPHVLLIPGTGSVGHLEENLGAAGVALDEEDMALLDQVEQHGDPLAGH